MNLKIQEFREGRHLSQAALAKAIGVSLRSIQNWERGESNITLKYAKTIAAFFNISLSDLLGETANSEKTVEKVNESASGDEKIVYELLNAKNQIIALQEKYIKILEEKNNIPGTIIETLRPLFQKILLNQDTLASALGNIVLDIDDILNKKKKA